MCYAHSDKEHGWCGTCKSDAEEGERGYCAYYSDDTPENSPENDPRENTIVKTNENWGFCSPTCATKWDYAAKLLSETKITILTDDECRVFANEESELMFSAGMSIVKSLSFLLLKILFSINILCERY